MLAFSDSRHVIDIVLLFFVPQCDDHWMISTTTIDSRERLNGGNWFRMSIDFTSIRINACLFSIQFRRWKNENFLMTFLPLSMRYNDTTSNNLEQVKLNLDYVFGTQMVNRFAFLKMLARSTGMVLATVALHFPFAKYNQTENSTYTPNGRSTECEFSLFFFFASLCRFEAYVQQQPQ